MASRQSSAYSRTRNRVRDRLRTEHNKAREQREETARRALLRAAQPQEAARKDRTSQAVLYNTALLTHKVLGSFGVNVPIRVSKMDGPSEVPVKAWTDFRSIDVHVDTSKLDIKDLHSVAEFVFMVKGAVYHEGGHNLFTMPFRTLQAMAQGEPYGYGLTGEWEALTKAYPMQLIHRCWNVLEDQRMERAMVDASPVIANYLTTIVYECVLHPDHLDRALPYITQRKYLDEDIRNFVRDEALATPNAYLVPDVERVVANYCTTNDIKKQIEALLEFVPLMDKWGFLPPTSESIHQHSATGASSPKPVPEDTEESERGESKPTSDKDNDNGNDTDTNDTNEGDTSDQGNDGEGLAESEPERTDAPPSSTPTDRSDSSRSRPDLRNKIQEELERLKQSSLNEAKQFAASIHEDINSELPRDPTGQVMPNDLVAKADGICNGIINSLSHLLDQTSPSWRFRQEQGVLDPTSYMLRDPGETDYWSGLDGIGNQGYDLSVSVLLDTSYSMCTSDVQLSVAALGIRKACDVIGIPCTVTTWNTSYNMLYRADEDVVPVLISATGGTEPSPMLDHLDAFRYGKRRQLVFILTDGEWEGVNTLGPWSSPGRYIVLVGLRVGWYTETFTNKNPDAFVQVREVEELPAQFRNALAGFLA